MTLLKDILYKVAIRSVAGNTGIEISDVQLDSRKVGKGCLFIAVKGVAADGHKFIEKAVEVGAAAVICEALPVNTRDGVTYVQVDNSAVAAGLIAHNFSDSRQIN